MSSGELPTARSHHDDQDDQVGGDEPGSAAEKAPRAPLSSSSRRSTLRPAPDDFRPSAAATSRRPMVIVYSGDSVRVPDWSAEPARPPSDGPPSELPRSEPLTLPGAPEPQSPASARAAQLQSPESAGWDDPELGSGSQPLPSLRGEGVAAAADRLTPLGPPWSEPPAPLPAAAPAPAKPRPRLHLLTAALSGGALLAIGYFTFSAPEPAHPVAAESAPPAAKVEQTERARPAPELPAASTAAPLPAALAAVTKGGATLAPARPAATAKAASAVAAAKAVSAPDAASASTRVRLEVIPADAKVGRRGFTQKGPPYYFEVPKGKRVQLEVVRKGYVTRKVTLDGTSSRVVVGLAKTRTGKR